MSRFLNFPIKPKLKLHHNKISKICEGSQKSVINSWKFFTVQASRPGIYFMSTRMQSPVIKLRIFAKFCTVIEYMLALFFKLWYESKKCLDCVKSVKRPPILINILWLKSPVMLALIKRIFCMCVSVYVLCKFHSLSPK